MRRGHRVFLSGGDVRSASDPLHRAAERSRRDARRDRRPTRADGHAAIQAIVNDTAEKFTYGHPATRFNDGCEEIPYLGCGLTEGLLRRHQHLPDRGLRAAGFEAGYVTGYFFPEEKNGCCDDMHCWVVTRHDGVVLEWDIAHHLKLGTREICCGLNPKARRRVATSHSMGLTFPSLGIHETKILGEPAWVESDGTLSRTDLDIRMTAPDLDEAAA
jgi:hypothetical protein